MFINIDLNYIFVYNKKHKRTNVIKKIESEWI